MNAASRIIVQTGCALLAASCFATTSIAESVIPEDTMTTFMNDFEELQTLFEDFAETDSKFPVMQDDSLPEKGTPYQSPLYSDGPFYGQPGSQWYISDPDAELLEDDNPNSTPIKRIDENDYFSVLDQTNGYFKVRNEKSGETGYINKNSVKNISIQPVIYGHRINPGISRQQAREARAKIKDKIIKRVLSMKEKYDSNPFIKVDGFTFNAVPPSFTLVFSFKED